MRPDPPDARPGQAVESRPTGSQPPEPLAGWELEPWAGGRCAHCGRRAALRFAPTRPIAAECVPAAARPARGSPTRPRDPARAGRAGRTGPLTRRRPQPDLLPIRGTRPPPGVASAPARWPSCDSATGRLEWVQHTLGSRIVQPLAVTSQYRLSLPKVSTITSFTSVTSAEVRNPRFDLRAVRRTGQQRQIGLVVRNRQGWLLQGGMRRAPHAVRKHADPIGLRAMVQREREVRQGRLRFAVPQRGDAASEIAGTVVRHERDRAREIINCRVVETQVRPRIAAPVVIAGHFGRHVDSRREIPLGSGIILARPSGHRSVECGSTWPRSEIEWLRRDPGEELLLTLEQRNHERQAAHAWRNGVIEVQAYLATSRLHGRLRRLLLRRRRLIVLIRKEQQKPGTRTLKPILHYGPKWNAFRRNLSRLRPRRE